MKLLVLLLVLALRRLDIQWPAWLGDGHRVRRLMKPLVQRSESGGLPEGLAWALAVLAPALALLVAFLLIQSMLWGLLTLVAGALVLLWLLGPVSEFRMLDEILVQGRMNDQQAFARQAQQHFAVPGEPGDRGYFDLLIQTVLHREARYLFATVFYLVTLGLPLALLYVLNRWLAQQQAAGSDLARTVDIALFWLPARLLILALALAGDFRRVMDAVGERLWRLDESDTVLGEALDGALDMPQEEPDDFQAGVDRVVAAQSLMQRALALWLIMAAIWVVLLG